MGSKFGLKSRDGYQPEKKITGEVIPPNTGSNVRVPKRGEPAQDTIKPWEKGDDPVSMQLGAVLYSSIADMSPTQIKIREITDAMKDLLLYKNQKYGDSAINPKKVFYKGDSTNSILIRLDDKLGRVMSNTEDRPRVNDVCDIIGYCTLLLISMGVTPEDIAKFKD